MGIKKTVKYERIERQLVYVIYRESFLIVNRNWETYDIEVPRVFGVFSTYDKAKEYFEEFLRMNELEYDKDKHGLNSSIGSKTYRDKYGNFLTLQIIAEELDSEINEISYVPYVSL